MKPSLDIRCDVQSQRVARATGDAPVLGTVQRISDVRRSSRRRRGVDRKLNELRLLVCFAALVLAGLGILALCIWLGLQPNSDGGRAIAPTTAVVMPQRDASLLGFVPPTPNEALTLVKKGLAARHTGQVAEWFSPGSATPEMVVAFLSGLEATDGVVTGMEWLGNTDSNQEMVVGVLVRSMKEGEPRNRLALLNPDDHGTWRIDFDAFARTVSPSWNQLLDGAATQGVVRVVVARDSYFNGPFHDEATWQCFGMTSPDTPVVMSGYCRKGSPQAAAMAWVLDDHNTGAPAHDAKRVVLEVRRPEGTGSRQFEITRVLAKDWLMGPKPFDRGGL